MTCGERHLLVAVIAQAVHDCEKGSPVQAVAAFRWLTQPSPWLMLYCELIDFSARMVSDGTRDVYGAKCEALARALEHATRSQRELVLASREASEARNRERQAEYRRSHRREAST